MKLFAEEIREVERTTGAVRSDSVAEATRGPKTSQAGPIARREKIEPTKEAIPAVPISVWVRLRSLRITSRSGGIAKVEKKHENRESHARWKARM